MTAVIEAVGADYPEYEITAHWGILYRAVVRGSMSPVHVEAGDEAELRLRLDTDRALRARASRRR